MKLFTIIFTLILFSGSQQTFAHSDHPHEPITDASALQLAKEATAQLAERDAGLGFGKLSTAGRKRQLPL